MVLVEVSATALYTNVAGGAATGKPTNVSSKAAATKARAAKVCFKEIVFLSSPVVLSNISRVLMSIFDVAMVGRLGSEALAATGMGGMLVWAPMSMALGIRTAVQTVSSRRLGQNSCMGMVLTV